MHDYIFIVLILAIVLIGWWKYGRTVETYEMPRPQNCAEVAVALDAKCAESNAAFPKDGPYADSAHKYCCK